MNHCLSRPLPETLKELPGLAMDLRWTGSQTASRVWQRLDPEMWERTRNPMAILMNAPQEQLEAAARDEELLASLRVWLDRLKRHEAEPSWFSRIAPDAAKRTSVAYFSMEFGLSEALPIYSGGLGMLAGDHLKSASSQGVPLTGIGLLYQQGYFHQVIGDEGSQIAVYPYNEPGSLPVAPVTDPDGGWLRVRMELPGRTLVLRLWEARVGAVRLLLLDSNDPMNSPRDRAITAQLYNADRQTRLLQELVLGAGGWMTLEKLGLRPDVCHLNEGHAAFAVISRAAAWSRRENAPFSTGLWATRAGNVFTTHTPVAAAFDRFELAMVRQMAEPFAAQAGVSLDDLLDLGREGDGSEVFNMAFLAMRGCGRVNGVSRLHGQVSRRLFAPLFPQWPYAEVPVSHITNGVHVPTWDSTAANLLWRKAYPGSWSRHLEEATSRLDNVPDEDLWSFRTAARLELVEFLRRRLARRCRERGSPYPETSRCACLLDPETLTIGFARRFTNYKRPGLLLSDPERLARILNHPERPVQLLISGKAHPNDGAGAARVREAALFCLRDDVRDRAVFVEDYDMAVAQQLTGGVDVWLNNPSRPNEACGTSGMKILVNGGLHLSTLDGWWDEACRDDTGWAFGGTEDDHENSDAADAGELYRLLETEIIPEFYERDARGLPRRWLRRVRSSMMKLTPVFSSDRMVREYVEQAYLPAAAQYHRRAAGGGAAALELRTWHEAVARAWEGVRFGARETARDGENWRFEIELALGSLGPEGVSVQIYREDPSTGSLETFPMEQVPHAAASDAGFDLYRANVPASHPPEHYTARVIARHPEAIPVLEAPFIRWQHGGHSGK